MDKCRLLYNKIGRNFIVIDKLLIAYCGTYCGACEWKDKMGCKGCKANAGNMFWGECDKAKCCMEKGFEHCGQCAEMPCTKLKVLFGDAIWIQWFAFTEIHWDFKPSGMAEIFQNLRQQAAHWLSGYIAEKNL